MRAGCDASTAERLCNALKNMPDDFESLADLEGVPFSYLPSEVAGRLSNSDFCLIQRLIKSLVASSHSSSSISAPRQDGGAATSSVQQRSTKTLKEEVKNFLDAEDEFVSALKDGYYAAKSKGPRASALKKYEALAAEKGWTPGADWDVEKIQITAAFLQKSTPQSAATYLSHIKTQMPPLSREAEKEYSRAYASLERSKKAPEQDAPLTYTLLKKLDAAAETLDDLSTMKGLVLAWFLLARPDEIQHLSKTEDKGGATYSWKKSKRDQSSHGMSVKFSCCCDVTVGFKTVSCCPVHVVSVEQLQSLKRVPTDTWRNRFYKLLEKAGIENKVEGRKRALYSLYSARVGGAQAAVISLGHKTTQVLGRWKSDDCALHYENMAVVAPADDVVIKWPLKSDDIKLLSK